MKKQDFIPFIIGTDLNCYTMSISFYEEYGIKPIVIGKGPISFTEGSTVIEKFYYTDQINDDEFFIEYLNRLAKDYLRRYEKIILIGTNDPYVNFIVRNQERLLENFEFSYISEELAQTIFLKKNFYQLAEENGLDIPLTFFYSCASKEDFNEEVPFPLIVKPSDNLEYNAKPFEGMQKVYKVDDHEELQNVINQIKAGGYRGELIIQDFIPGDDTYMWDAVYYGNRNKKARLISLAQVTLQEPTTTGVGNYTSLIVRENKELMDQLVQFMEKIDYVGFGNFDMKYDPRDGKYKVFEINIRQGRSSYYLTQCGFNIAKIIVDDVIYNKNNSFEYVKGDHIFSVVPRGVLKLFIKDPEINKEVRDLISDNKYKNPIFYKEDKGFKRKFLMFLRQVNYFRKYRYNPLK